MFCRESSGNHTLGVFKLLSCTLCYNYIMKMDAKFYKIPIPGPEGFAFVAGPESGLEQGTPVIADAKNASSVNIICSTMDEEKCEWWKTCCDAAEKCCEQQLNMGSSSPKPGYCPRTWDGFGCFDDTKAGSRAYLDCPVYVEHSLPYAQAYKDCTENGTWFSLTNAMSGQTFEWTNYSTCLDIEDQQQLVYVGLTCSLISIILLVPSCIVFLAFRQLRVQQRIRLHVCLFLSFTVSAVLTILWDFLVVYDRVEKAQNREESLMVQNTAGCKLMYVLHRYIQMCNYFWMFCEGFYLHRLIVHAFEVPKTLIGYYIFGWGGSWVPIIIYSIVRAVDKEFDQTNCWVKHAGGLEYVIYVPILVTLAINIFFFVNILRILLTQLQSHPNEPSNYRRAFRATFVLVPLFGIQSILVIYRPDTSRSAMFVYEVAKTIVINTQGGIISLIFCVFNGEVHTHIKNLIRKRWPSFMNGDTRFTSVTSTTQYTNVQTSVRRSPRLQESQQHQSYIPLDTVDDASRDVTKTNGHVTFKETNNTVN
ncbi:calcitonin gene-related peptide type 1 receptor-like isoform X1 [Pecten maximus]|uniref:calcitonin gene-related peptide type 1 receptor-like isoform X1 n=1 Tax=Pecten maximus TaxID=6579 RepID=UPI00145840DD|nr:calcitonin gene-related peptide type 1 receptor-like isoform X1 [Pecten maximus]XP_033762873.1 calcitonin gene-related peptide type 1 receptor-like isoform X1 [Pecten maximus]XP_033762874.1 calcitonin gene-related peptide type 1 receptor-like isoform X1 [Pecten maximus]